MNTMRMSATLCTAAACVAVFVILLAPVVPAYAQINGYPVVDDYPLPESVTLCGEQMPLEDRYVWEMLDREFTIIVWDRAQIFMWLKRAGRYFPYIEKRLAEEKMPDDLKYLAVAESSLLSHIRSSQGAVGFWQFMSLTAKRNGLRKDQIVDERSSFEHSTEAALKNLKRLKEGFGTWSLALAAYNCGEARLGKEIKLQGVKDYYRLDLPPETERFVFRIAAIKIVMEDPERYGYNLAPERAYQPLGYDTVPVKSNISINIADFASALEVDFKVIKELNPHIHGPRLPTGDYTVNVPSGLWFRAEAALKKLIRKEAPHMEDDSDHCYVVQPGDTLSHIAQRKGVSMEKIRSLNGLQGSLLRVGQRLRLGP